MNLRCQWKGTKCPPYVHEGVFEATHETLSRFEPDLNWCAKCTTYAKPSLPSFQDDLLQIARITLWKKGPLFDPNHAQQASFRTYILPRICGALTRAKNRETQHWWRFMPPSTEDKDSEIKAAPQDRFISLLSDSNANFVDTLIWEMWNADFEQALPQLLQCLTKREQQVFAGIRANMKQCEIANRLELSRSRVNQLKKKIKLKLTAECQNLKLIE